MNMASSRVLESRWIRRYRLFFVLGTVILCFQVYLAYKFFPDNVNYQERGDKKDAFEKNNDDVLRYFNGVSSRRSKESYIVADYEDSPGNSNPLPNVQHSKQKVPPDKIDTLSDVVWNNFVVSNVPANMNLKNQRPLTINKSVQLEELNFVPLCEVATKEAISAIHRAKTQECKQKIVNTTCLKQTGRLYPYNLSSSCPTQGFTAGKSLGCFRDDKTLRLLSGYYANLKTTNSPQRCINMCLQSGFPFAGVQFSTQCFCGNDEPPSIFRLPDSSCNMKCPANPKEACGGSFTINIYESGIAKFTPRVPKEISESTDHPVRIAFLLTLNGRALRQVKRLIKALFHVEHYFYIHVDARQDYLFRELLQLENVLPNVRIARRRYATIWGGASLLQMLLASMTELLKINWQWDFVINLSESDFPVKTNIQLVEFLTANKEHNFVKSHGHEVQRFIQKQGLDKTFVECDAHMWRIGDRHFPWGIQVDGGSDWVALSRSFVSYVAAVADEKATNKDPLLEGLSVVFQHTLLPAETYFHTVLRNSKFCNTYVDNNLHVTNWKRRLGCKCQYKHIVDWCGCSPNDFKPDDWPRLQGTEGRQLFFARKFEPIINQAIIDRIENWLYGPFPSDVPSLQSYWQSLYHHADLSPTPDDSLLTLSMSFSRLSSRIINSETCILHPNKILEITSYHHSDTYMGTLVMFEGKIADETVHLETFVKPRHFMSIQNSSGMFKRLKSLHISSDYDQKEQLSRNFLRVLGPHTEPVLIYQFHPDSNSNNAKGKNANHVSTSCIVLWIDPAGHLAEVSDLRLEHSVTNGSFKPLLREPLLPGVWVVLLLYDGAVTARTQFLVTPLQFVLRKEITPEQARSFHRVPNTSHDASDWDKYIQNMNSSALHTKAMINSQLFGRDLEKWIDTLTSRFYEINDYCLISSVSNFESLCPNLKDFCSNKSWSSIFPDPKCNITSVNATTGQLNRW